MRHVSETKCNVYAIEIAPGERKLFAVALYCRNGCSLVEHPVAPDCEHRVIDVREPNLAAAANLLQKQYAQIRRSAGDVEHPLPLPDSARFHRKPLPRPVQAGGHQVV